MKFGIPLRSWLTALLLAYSALDTDSAQSQTRGTECPKPPSLIENVYTRIRSSNLAIPQKLSCADVVTLSMVDPDKIEITTGRRNGEAVVCMGSSRDFPCQYIVGIFKPGLDPSHALAMIFSISVSPSANAPLNETTERLFIKPAAVIR